MLDICHGRRARRRADRYRSSLSLVIRISGHLSRSIFGGRVFEKLCVRTL